MLLIDTATESAAYNTFPWMQRSCDAIHSCSRLGYFSRLRRQYACPSLANSFTLLSYSKAAIRSIRRSVPRSVFQSNCSIGANDARFQERYSSRHPVVSAQPSSGHERSGSSGIPVQSTRSHHSAALSPVLVTCAGANFLQASRATYTNASTDSRRPTWQTTYNRLLNSQADNAYVHRRHRHWLYHRPGFEPLVIELFPSQQQKRGTVSLPPEVTATRSTSSSSLSTFKSKLKTYLFSLSFPDLVTVK